MPQIHTVKAARKDYPEAGIKKGETYYWYSQRIYTGGRWVGRTTKTKIYPKQSQLAHGFRRDVLLLQETYDFNKAGDFAELEMRRDEVKVDIEQMADEERAKLDNMPEQFQDGEAGQIIHSRIEGMEEVLSSLDAVNIPNDDDVKAEIAERQEEASEQAAEYDQQLLQTISELDEALSQMPV